jgi:nitrous oxidase accessory protein
MRKNVALLVVLVFLATLCLTAYLPVRAESKIIIVPDDFPTIQEAINAAQEGDTIYVKKGYYEGSFNQTLEINKAINLYGEDRSATILSLSPPLVPMNIFTYEYMGYLASIQINSNNVKISGLTINTPGGDLLGKGDQIQILGVTAATGFSIEGKQAKISENTIMGDLDVFGNNNTFNNNHFEIKAEGVTPTIDCVGANNIIANNTLATKKETSNIKLNIEGANNLIANNLLSTIHLKGSNNIIYKNSIKAVPGNSGVYLSHSSANTICANRITYAESITYQQEGVFLSESYDNVVYANNIESVFKGVYLQNTDTAPMVTNNNTVYHNNFINNQIQAWDTTTSTTNTFDNGKEGNYWSSYNGTDANNDGIGDSPYKPTSLYIYGDVRKTTECSPDNYPLMAPFDIDNVTIEFPDWSSALLNPSSTPIPYITQHSTINTGAETPKTEPFPTLLIVVVSVVAVAMMVAGLLVYHKKQRKLVQSD